MENTFINNLQYLQIEKKKNSNILHTYIKTKLTTKTFYTINNL